VSTRLKQLSVLHTSRADLFTSSTTQTTINVAAKRFRRVGQTPFDYGTHQVKPAAWTIIFVAGNYVGGTCFQAKSAMNAGQKLLFLERESVLE